MQADIVEPTEMEGRFRKRFSLKRFGIDAPTQS